MGAIKNPAGIEFK